MDHEDLEFDSPEALLDPFRGHSAPDPVDEAFASVAGKGKEEEGEEEEEEEEDGDPMTAMSPPRPTAAVAQKAPVQQQQQQAQPSQGMVRKEARGACHSLSCFFSLFQGITPQQYSMELARIRKLPNEKERMQAMANLMTAKKNGTSLPAPQSVQPQPQQQQQRQQQAKKQEVSAFPSPQDLSDMEAFVYWTTLALVVHGQFDRPLPFK